MTSNFDVIFLDVGLQNRGQNFRTVEGDPHFLLSKSAFLALLAASDDFYRFGARFGRSWVPPGPLLGGFGGYLGLL